jgi:hypothetical protein
MSHHDDLLKRVAECAARRCDAAHALGLPVVCVTLADGAHARRYLDFEDECPVVFDMARTSLAHARWMHLLPDNVRAAWHHWMYTCPSPAAHVTILVTLTQSNAASLFVYHRKDLDNTTSFDAAVLDVADADRRLGALVTALKCLFVALVALAIFMAVRWLPDEKKK